MAKRKRDAASIEISTPEEVEAAYKGTPPAEEGYQRRAVRERNERQGWIDLITKMAPILKVLRTWKDLEVPWDASDPESVKAYVRLAMETASAVAEITDTTWDDDLLAVVLEILENDQVLGAVAVIIGRIFASRSALRECDGCPCVTDETLGDVLQGDEAARLIERGVSLEMLRRIADAVVLILRMMV